MKTKKRILLGLFTVLMMPASAATLHAAGPQVAEPVRMAEVASGELLAPASGAEGLFVPLPGLRTDVRISVTGIAAQVEITQEFTNPSTSWLEAVYVFPMPGDSAVTGLRMQVADRVIEGVVKEKRRARQQYVDARREGRKASLVGQQRPNLFTSSVANIPPGDSIRITLTYLQTVTREDGAYSVRVPLAAGPRYLPRKATSHGGRPADSDPAMAAAPLRNPNTIAPRRGRVNPVSIEFDLDAGFELDSVTSAYHSMDITRAGDTRAGGRLVGTHYTDRDFELRWRAVAGSATQLAAFANRQGEADYVLLMLQPPLPDTDAAAASRELILVIDTSGSMHGDSIEQALAAARFALSTLGPGDRFNLVRFSDTPSTLFPGSQPASPAALAEAERFLSRIDADGGTNMASALRRAFAIPPAPKLLRQLVFLTDGAVGNEAALFSLIERGIGDSRLFTVGIGSAPNDYFMRRAARAGRGSHTYIGHGDEVAARMKSLFQRLRRPALTDIRVDWGGARVDGRAARVPDLYYSEPLTLTARVEDFRGVTVHGQYAGQAWRHRIEPRALSGAAWVSTLWARERISQLNDELRGGGDQEQLKQDITRIGLDHQLVTPYTSLVAVERRVSRDPSDPLYRADTPVNLPHGWSYEHVFGALPQTAVGWRARVAAGIGLMFLALVILCSARGARRVPV